MFHQHRLTIKEFDLLDPSVFDFVKEQSASELQNQEGESDAHSSNSIGSFYMMMDNRLALSSAILSPSFTLLLNAHMLSITRLLRSPTLSPAPKFLHLKQSGQSSGDHTSDMFKIYGDMLG